MSNEKDTEIISDQAIEDIIAILDGYNRKEGNRLKINVTEGEGVTAQYHHGRCDIGSPYACGLDFPVEEDR